MAEGGFWSRLRFGGGAGSALEADLRRITEAESIDTPDKDTLRSIAQASHNADDRREILRHLQECLAESSGRRWRRVHGGLVLLEELLKNGSPVLVTELSEGMHFDPVQRLTFIERFEYKEDRRVQGIVRQKATVLRGDLIERLQGDSGDTGASTEDRRSSAVSSSGGGRKRPTSASDKGDRYIGFGSDTGGAPGGGGSAAGPSSAYVGFGSDDVSRHLPDTDSQAPRKNVVNGLVAVGHRDDTDSDSDEDQGRRSRGRGGRQEKPRSSAGIVHARDGRKALEDSTDSDSDDSRPKRDRRAKGSTKPEAPPKPPPPPTPAVEVDLLGGFDSPPAAPALASQDASNLLDF